MAFFGPFWPPGAPPGGGTPPLRPGGAENPPPEGGVGPWDPPGGVRNLASQPIFHREFAGGQVAHQGGPLGLPLFGPFWPFLTPPGGGPPPSGPPPGGGSPPLNGPPGPLRSIPPGGLPPPSEGPSGPCQMDLGRISRRLIGKFLRVCQDFPGILIGSTGVLACISPLGGGHSQISSTRQTTKTTQKAY